MRSLQVTSLLRHSRPAAAEARVGIRFILIRELPSYDWLYDGKGSAVAPVSFS